MMTDASPRLCFPSFEYVANTRVKQEEGGKTGYNNVSAETNLGARTNESYTAVDVVNTHTIIRWAKTTIAEQYALHPPASRRS